jgi:sugar phosphate isomerase/epimerase
MPGQAGKRDAQVKRREFLGQALALGLAVQMPGRAEETAPAFRFPTEPRERIAVATYPFSKLVDPKKGTLPLLEFPKFVVEQFGVFAIEPLNDHFASTEATYLEGLRSALEDHKVRIANIATGLGGSLYDPKEDRRRKVLDRARHWIDVAHAVNSPCIRLHLEGTKRVKTDVPTTAASLRHLAEYGREKRVVIHLENDSPTTEDAFLIAKIILEANTPWIRALPDFGNAMAQDKGETFNLESVREMFRYAYGICHVKDSLRTDKEVYRFDLKRLLDVAQKARYAGYYSIEYDEGGDALKPTKKLIETTAAAIS